jgi:cytochrome P450
MTSAMPTNTGPINAADLDLYTITDLERPSRDEWLADIVEAQRKHPFLMRTPIGYSITTYEHCVGVLRERRFHSAIAFLAQMQGLSPDMLQSDRRPSILASEGDEHGRLRRLAAPAFTPKAADRLRPYMRSVIERLVDAIAPTGRTELVADVCEPYPIPVVCELLGAPEADWRLFSRWATDLLSVFNGNIAEDFPRINQARNELRPYMAALIEERRIAPKADLISDMIAIEQANDRLTNDEVTTMAEAVLIAGTDTTRNQLGCTMALFARHPDQWKLLCDDPGLAPRAVEESMRVLGAVRGTARVASEDIDYNGVWFPAGTFVFPSFIAGNLDESTWGAMATEFDITREPTSSPHLTFGSGIHFCLGAWLARAELQEALPILADRFGPMAVDGTITWKPSAFGIWGPERLPLTFTGRSPG